MVSNCLFPIETHLICDFPEGVRTPCPPLDPHLCSPHSFMVKATIHYLIWAWQTLIDRRMYHPFIVVYLIISVYYRNLRCLNRSISSSFMDCRAIITELRIEHSPQSIFVRFLCGLKVGQALYPCLIPSLRLISA